MELDHDLSRKSNVLEATTPVPDSKEVTPEGLAAEFNLPPSPSFFAEASDSVQTPLDQSPQNAEVPSDSGKLNDKIEEVDPAQEEIIAKEEVSATEQVPIPEPEPESDLDPEMEKGKNQTEEIVQGQVEADTKEEIPSAEQASATESESKADLASETQNVEQNADIVPETEQINAQAELDQVQVEIDAKEEVPLAEQVPIKPKPDLIGQHKHLNPLLSRHPHSEEHDHDHDHHHHDHEHDHHHHEHRLPEPDASGSSFIFVIKHLSSTLINFLPEHLQDTILDVNDALVFTGIIALTLISICVPYFFIETFLSVRPLKKKVTELNKTLWKVSTAYENQQEEYDMFKKKALAYDEDKKRIEQLEVELDLLKTLESKQKDKIRQQQKELKSSAKVASEVESLVVSTMEERNKVSKKPIVFVTV